MVRRLSSTLLALCLCLPFTLLNAFPVGRQTIGRTTTSRAASISEPSHNLEGDGSLIRTKGEILTVATHICGCLVSAVLLCGYEDYDCQNLKPNVYLRPHAVRGMGEGAFDRVRDWRGGNVLVSPSDVSLIKIPSYNEVMERHRNQRVPSWNLVVGEEKVKLAMVDIYNAVGAVNQLKAMADNYEWDGMRDLIRQPVVTSKLEAACTFLRSASVLNAEVKTEVGFDWGSCAWRHCGAEADAQESLAELYNLVGVLEPFECRFILDIVERSLRDVVAVVPPEYYPAKALPAYEPYQSKQSGYEGESQLDSEFLQAISDFRNPQWDD